MASTSSSNTNWHESIKNNKFEQRKYHAVLLLLFNANNLRNSPRLFPFINLETPAHTSVRANVHKTCLDFDNFINDRMHGTPRRDSGRLIFYGFNTNYTSLKPQHRRCVGALMLKCVICNYTIQRILMSLRSRLLYYNASVTELDLLNPLCHNIF